LLFSRKNTAGLQVRALSTHVQAQKDAFMPILNSPTVSDFFHVSISNYANH